MAHISLPPMDLVIPGGVVSDCSEGAPVSSWLIASGMTLQKACAEVSMIQMDQCHCFTDQPVNR